MCEIEILLSVSFLFDYFFVMLGVLMFVFKFVMVMNLLLLILSFFLVYFRVFDFKRFIGGVLFIFFYGIKLKKKI